MYSSSYSAMARLTIDNPASPLYPLPPIKDTLSPPPGPRHAHSYSYSSSSSTPSSARLPPIAPPLHSQSNSGPSRTGRKHSQSVSSTTSPYPVYSPLATPPILANPSAGTSANTSFGNLRSSFMNQSPPGPRYPPYPHHPDYDPPPHPGLGGSLHRHHSASSLPPNAHGPAYASSYHASTQHSRAPPIYHPSRPEYDPPTTGPRKRRSSTSASRTSTLQDSADSERRESMTGSDHGHGPFPAGLALGFGHEETANVSHSGADSPHLTPRSAYSMTPNHSGGPGQPLQRRQQGFAVPGHSTTPPAGDPSAVRRLAHLQCEQRRRESINGGFATLRTILPETTNADSKAAILQKAINYIQHLEQAVRASGGKIENAVKSAAGTTPTATGKAPSRKQKSSLSTSTSEVTSPTAGSDTSPAVQRGSLGPDGEARKHSSASSGRDDAMSPIRDAAEDMAVDMEMSDDEGDREREYQTKEKRGALYMLGSVASAAAAAFDSRPPLPELHYGRDATRPPSSMRNRLGFLKGSSSARAPPQDAEVMVDMTSGKDIYDDGHKVVGAMWEHVENRGRVFRP